MCEQNDFNPQRLEGVCFQFGGGQRQRHLHAFVSNAHNDKALVLLHGLTEGIMSYSWIHSLNKSCAERKFALVQVNMSSSFLQFGTSNLFQDAAEIHQLITGLNKEFGISKIVLMGHSTGCQDIVTYLRLHGKEDKHLLKGAILLGAVSDRECIANVDYFTQMMIEAHESVSAKMAHRLLSHKLFDAPITAYRFDSFASRLGDDDMFSTDLTNNELENILKPLELCDGPVLFCYANRDEFVQCQTALKDFTKRLIEVVKTFNKGAYCEFVDGGHDLNTQEEFDGFKNHFTKFLESIS